MVLTRAFDAKAVALQRTGRLGTFASSLGQEAVGVGAASAMAADDVLVPSFRDQAAQLWRGVTPVELLLYWGGDERGSDFAGPRADFPISVPVAKPCATCGRRRIGDEVASRSPRRAVHHRRRRDIEGRLLRGAQRRRRLAPAAGRADQQQSMGDLGPAFSAERSTNSRAEGDRRGHSWRAGRRQRCDRGSRLCGTSPRARPRR